MIIGLDMEVRYMPRLDKDTMRAILLRNPPSSVSAHTDADGVTSAVLSYLVFKQKRTSFQSSFRDVKMSDGVEAELVLDKVPPREYTLYCIDHHTEHEANPKYNLLYDDIPAGGILLETFRDIIPKDEQWKAVVSFVGDQEPEKIPDYIWSQNKFLFDEVSSLFTSYGSLKMSTNPIWSKLSMPINMTCRAGKPTVGYNKLLAAKSPLELLIDPEIRSITIEVYKEIKRLENEATIVDLGALVFWETETGMPQLTGMLASKLYSSSKKTAVVVNSADGHISIRGVLCTLIKHKLQEYNIGGHPLASAGELPLDKTPADLLRDLRRILQ